MRPEADDHRIQQDVLRELAWDTRVSETDVGVTVRHGIVTLTGTVDSYARKLAAQEAAHRVSGVYDVANDLRVAPPGSERPGDTTIAAAVRHALEWDALVPHEEIRSTVADGWVTLDGHVRFPREREDAERAVGRLAGVHGVINRLAVSETGIEADRLRRVIEQALARRGQREARHLTIEVENGTVTLAGRVGSSSEKRALLGLVSHTPGVRDVRDGLEIDPP